MIPALLLALSARAGATPAAETPRRFVERLYAGYRNENWSPLSHPERVFGPALVDAIREERRLSRDEVGFMDADPLCECQDASGLHAAVRSVAPAGKAAATAHVSLRFGDGPASRDPDNRRELVLKLVRSGAGWRIADVSGTDEPSLLRDLQAWNRRKRGERSR